MIRARHLALVAAPFALAACGAAPTPVAPDLNSAELSSQAERLLAGKVAGEPVSCIRALEADRPLDLPNGATLYRANANEAYLQTFGGQCDRRSGTYLVRRSTMTQLCRGDIAEVISRPGNFPVGSCVYSDFIPYRTPAR